MQRRLAELTEALEQSSATLLSAYRAEDLYALRVGMRRVRSLLKPLGSDRSRQFRKAWGGFAAVTNHARDWDVFLLTAFELLPEPQWQAFETQNRRHVLSSHEAVIELLESALWRRHLLEWRQYLERPHGHEENELTAPQSLDTALAGARSALANALEAGDERSWHKLRIAVKEIRYQAESGPGGAAATPELAALIEHCKPLQSVLGRWHDCVVQLQMLDELDPAPAHGILQDVIEQRRVQGLAEIHQTVVDHPLFEQVESSTTSARSASSSGS